MTEFPDIEAPDAEAEAQARARQETLTKPSGALGRLEDLSVWVAACQGVCPPRQFERPRVVVFAGDHGVTAAGVSAYPAEVTAQMVANFDAGGAAINVLAELAGAGVRVVDVAVDGDAPHSPSIGAHKIRRSSGNIAVEDALSAAETDAAIEAGRRIVDEEVDAGADLLIAGDMGIGNTTAATTLIAALTNSEPVAVVGRGTGVDDAGWARKTATPCSALARCARIPLGCCGFAAVPISRPWRASSRRPPYDGRRCCSTASW
jgi:nicotinate-nucleotide--dimethylbenzimidazole phosphoribosyltransferase